LIMKGVIIMICDEKCGGRRIASFMAGLTLFVLLFAAASYLICVVISNYFYELTEGEKMIPVASVDKMKLVAIDPGHGGEDGGSSSGEILEKDLNLAVSKDIYYLCVLTGVPAKLTRTEDAALYDLYDDLEDYTGKRKVYDLKNRVRFVKEEGAGIYLGIHMNKFPEEKYRGLQVWYSKNNKDSRYLAEKIQSGAREHLDGSNDREIKKATSSIFVLDRIEVPAVLVECGFLSNPEDLSLLTDPGYRRKLASSIFSSVVAFSVNSSY
ncbi:MAG: N-acetylmuramoyl-L-alanine amidase, partial [Clostridia bacterium]|nr:N-acetylmuramoyl-L-alanine amidase [Clostridia bacterium]